MITEKSKGLWHNIHQKRKRGERMRKKGEKGAPSDAAIKRAQEAVKNSDVDLMLKRGETYILKQDREDYARGLLITMNENGSYTVAYWLEDAEPYPIEVIVDGKSVKKDGKLIKLNFHPKLDEAAERIPRKKGQHKGSSSHSDLYTDENPKGTIKGLGFKDATTANKGVAIINKAKRKHAHKVQATLVMQQRAKEAIKNTKDPEKKENLRAALKIWTDHLEKLKAKTKKMNETFKSFLEGEGKYKGETWEQGYKRRVVKTTDPEHKEKGYKWRIKGKERNEISIKLYKEKPDFAEYKKQMRRVAGHEFGG